MVEDHGQKIWSGRYFGNDGAILETKRDWQLFWRHIDESFIDVERGMQVASDYYSAATNQAALAKQALRRYHLLLAMFFGLRTFLCLRRARHVIEYFLRHPALQKKLNADQLDVAASVMYRWLHRRTAQKLAVIGIAAYEREPERYQPHNFALLKLHLARTEKNDRLQADLYREIEAIAPQAAEKSKLQGTRIYRTLAEYYQKLGEREELQNERDRRGGEIILESPFLTKAKGFALEAEALARESGATDQLVKIGAKS